MATSQKPGRFNPSIDPIDLYPCPIFCRPIFGHPSPKVFLPSRVCILRNMQVYSTKSSRTGARMGKGTGCSSLCNTWNRTSFKNKTVSCSCFSRSFDVKINANSCSNTLLGLKIAIIKQLRNLIVFEQCIESFSLGLCRLDA